MGGEEVQEVTLGEVHRLQLATRADLAEMRTELGNRPDWKDLQRVETGVVTIIAAETKAREEKQKLQDQAISKLEGWWAWVGRLGGGALGLAVLGLVLAKSDAGA